MATTARKPITDWGRASCLALVAALERDELALIDPDALAAPWSRVAKLATETRPLPDDGAVGFARLLTPGWCSGADIGGPAWVEERFWEQLANLDATSTEYLMDRARLLGERTADGERETERMDGAGAGAVELVRASDLKMRRVRWWWRGRLALGKLTVLEGPQDVGKSTVLVDIAARVTRGDAMPDGTAAPEGPGDVLMVATAEDGGDDTIGPRLAAAGADMDRVTIWRGRRQDGGYIEGFQLTGRDLAEAERIIRERGVRLVVIDALMASIPDGTNEHRDASMRRLLHPLAHLAETTGAIVIANRHHRKGGGSANDRGGGSVSIGAVARAVLAVVRDPDDETRQRRILGTVKCNLVPEEDKQSIEFTIGSVTVRDDEGDTIDASRVHWGGVDPRRLDEIFRAGDDDKAATATTDCADALTEMLTDGPRLGAEVEEALKSESFTPTAIRKARKRLGIDRESGRMWQDGFRGPWFWSLTPRSDPTGANT